ncbi:hypothetical protein ACWEKT_20630 [Nocardia takedensis]
MNNSPARRRLRIAWRRLTLGLPHALRPSATLLVYLNEHELARRGGYRRFGCELALAHEYLVPSRELGSASLMCHRAYTATHGTTAHPEDRHLADTWAAHHLRPLAVGDVIAIDDRYYTLDNVHHSDNWWPIDTPSPAALRQHRNGTATD